MGNRGRPKGSVPSAAQRAAGERNMAAGRANRQKRLDEGTQETAKQRWAKLIDGTITVQDLTDAELKDMTVHGKGGMRSAKPRALPSHLAQAMRAEWLARGQRLLEKNYHKALTVLAEIADDPDSKDSDRLKAANTIIERVAGRSVEHVHVTSDDPWAKMVNEVLDDERTMDELSDLLDE